MLLNYVNPITNTSHIRTDGFQHVHNPHVVVNDQGENLECWGRLGYNLEDGMNVGNRWST
jgi:hypothetical protein